MLKSNTDKKLARVVLQLKALKLRSAEPSVSNGLSDKVKNAIACMQASKQMLQEPGVVSKCMGVKPCESRVASHPVLPDFALWMIYCDVKPFHCTSLFS